MNKKFFLLFGIGFFFFVLGVKCYLIQKYGSDIPYMDQWNGEGTSIILPWLENEFDFIESFWSPHNEHRIGWTRLWALGWVKLNGQWDPLLVTTINSFIHILVGLSLIFILRKFLSTRFKWLIFIVSISTFSMPVSWENTLQAFQIQVYFSLACALCAISTLTNCKFYSLAGIFGIMMAFAGIPCLSTAFAPPATILFARNLYAYRRRKWDKDDILVSISCLIILIVSFASIHPHPGHEPLHAKNILQFCEFFIKVCSIPYHHYDWFVCLVVALIIQSPFLLFVIHLLKKDKVWKKHELTLVAIGIWIFLQTLAISYSRGNSDLAVRHLDTFSILLIINATALIYLIDKKINLWQKKIIYLSVVWFAVICIGLVTLSNREINNTLINMPQKWHKMKGHITNYLVDGNQTKFESIPIDDLPFINHLFMINMLDNEYLKKILPVGCRKSLSLQDYKNIGFTDIENQEFLINDNKNKKYFSSNNKICYWESTEIDNNYLLPILRINFAGHKDLSTTSIRIESGGEIYPLNIKKFHGNRWQTAHLFIPQRHESFKLVVENSDPGKWIAFQNPYELGRYSWFAHQFRKFYVHMILIGLITFLFLVSISPKNINSLSTNLFKLFKRTNNLLIAILLAIFTSLILSYAVNIYYFSSILSFIIISLSFYFKIILISTILKKRFESEIIIYTLSLIFIFILIYIGFWFSLFYNIFGNIYYALIIFFTYCFIFLLNKKEIVALGNNFNYPLLLTFITGLIYISIYYAKGSIVNIENTAASLWHNLPIDNAIPRLFADAIYAGDDPRNILRSLEWTSSDRPPLQACFILLYKPLELIFPFDKLTFSYIGGFVFNLLWIPAVWFFVGLFRCDNKSKTFILLILISTPFFVINSIYTWPKLGAASFIILSLVFLFKRKIPFNYDYFISVILFCFAWLSHGGVAITILPLIIFCFFIKKFPNKKTILYCSTLLFVVLLPWVLYQKVYDPPGNRLLKWHIAGVIDVDSRGFLEALYQSYKNTDVIENIKRIHSNINLLYGNSFNSFNIFKIPLENRVFDFFYFSRSFVFPFFCFVFLFIFNLFMNSKLYLQKYKIFFLITFSSLYFWCIIMFIPSSTINHHGSYANNILILVLILLYIRDFKINILYIIIFYNIIYFSTNYIL